MVPEVTPRSAQVPAASLSGDHNTATVICGFNFYYLIMKPTHYSGSVPGCRLHNTDFHTWLPASTTRWPIKVGFDYIMTFRRSAIEWNKAPKGRIKCEGLGAKGIMAKDTVFRR